MGPSFFVDRDRFVWLPASLLLVAVAVGIVAGASISMYYDVVPGMGSYEDTLSSVPAAVYALAVVLSFSYLPLALMAAKARQWKQTSLLTIAAIAPFAIFLASEGLLSHYLWWAPISDTNRFHMLHHTVVVATPLSAIYFLFLRSRWRPHQLTLVPSPSPMVLLITAIGLPFVVMAVGTTLIGLQPASSLAIAALITGVVFVLSRRMAG